MSRTAANLMLLIAALLWGAGNVAQKTVLDHLGPVATVGLRCAIAALAIGPFVVILRSARRQPGFTASVVPVAALFVAAMTIQQAAYKATSVTNASFLVNTGTIITPILAWLWLREEPSWSLAFAVPLAAGGALLMSGAALGEVSAGDAECIVSALLYAAWTVQLGRHVQRFDAPATTALMQFGVGAFLCLPVGLMLEPAPLRSISAARLDLLVLGVFSTAAAYGLQALAQRHTPAGHAAVIISAESIFGAAGAFLILSERTGLAGLLGAGLITMGIVTIAIWPGGAAGGSGRGRPLEKAGFPAP
jgi:drug/metabolite transporter (DMT)-like permease